jgi:hypothetical protein
MMTPLPLRSGVVLTTGRRGPNIHPVVLSHTTIDQQSLRNGHGLCARTRRHDADRMLPRGVAARRPLGESQSVISMTPRRNNTAYA